MCPVEIIDGMMRKYSPIPSFNGLHNRVKMVAWTTLSLRQAGITLKDLAVISGLNYGSLNTLLRRWLKWKFVSASGSRPRKFKLASRGRKWLKRWYPTYLEAQL